MHGREFQLERRPLQERACPWLLESGDAGNIRRLLTTRHQSQITGARGHLYGLVLSHFGIYALSVSAVAKEASRDELVETRTVILLHGLGSTHRSMDDMSEALSDAGYVVENIDYPPTDHSFEKLVKIVGEKN